MKRINILDQNTSNKIAAGEVVERPSSVVKELIENSIDANAKNITIEIEDGGSALIRIIDDGDGIHKDDISKAFLPHATSKIKSVEDIYSISSLGFRGEALASIASVSCVNLKSKPQDEDFGAEITIEDGKILEIKEVGLNKGTIMEVKDLFFNIPARKKFLKTSSREGSLINDIVNRISLSNPDISFKYFNFGKKILHTYGSGNLKDVIRTIYGKTISDNLIYFESNGDEISISGYIGKEEIARGSRNNQSIFVNGRYVKNRTLVAAVENAFKSFATVNKFPFFVLFVDVYPEFVDVNIHPSKEEIKFKEDRVVFKKVFEAVHRAFKEEVFNSFQVPEERYNEQNEIPSGVVENMSFNINYKEAPYNYEKEEKLKESPEKAVIREVMTSITIDDVKKEEELYNKLRSLGDKGKLNTTDGSPFQYNTDISVKDRLVVSADDKATNVINSLSDNSIDYEKIEVYKSEIHKSVENSPKFPKLRIIGQFNKTYILAEFEEVLYLVDQHAAHEKILFEKYLKQIESGSIIIQPLLIPALIDLTIDDYCYYEENKEIFNKAGFNIEAFGGNTVSIKEVPYFLGKLDPKNLFISILDNLKNLGSGKTTEVKYNRISTMACKAAVKANDYLTEIEMQKLINDLRFIEDPFHCPHGRPVIIKFTSYELDKKFRRIV
ncbi:DNA mismatch repair endonuclease MutL [Clostridium gasigenes]|uniref:DNA mismatch repair endonuclease MutL n=1 Tax=Clostridium gasigenes TaxID=94869 RepID=UPI0014384967|nr:DNA mismatch repair endonuclease MutL [Clostridium gasigenes]NKF05429.1 DNA mismatch repair endonuclease MutL [Clostridium gasigenes]QSW18876.1 DNA mismatch repair endonuclease MutL [Clostridium gasigenes]